MNELLSFDERIWDFGRSFVAFAIHHVQAIRSVDVVLLSAGSAQVVMPAQGPAARGIIRPDFLAAELAMRKTFTFGLPDIVFGL